MRNLILAIVVLLTGVVACDRVDQMYGGKTDGKSNVQYDHKFDRNALEKR